MTAAPADCRAGIRARCSPLLHIHLMLHKYGSVYLELGRSSRVVVQDWEKGDNFLLEPSTAVDFGLTIFPGLSAISSEKSVSIWGTRNKGKKSVFEHQSRAFLYVDN